MSEKRIQRKHFLAAIGAAMTGVLSVGGLFSGRSDNSVSALRAENGLPVPQKDPRAVSRPAHR